MIERIRLTVNSAYFQNFITGVIIFSAVLIGIETYPEMIEKYGSTLHFLDKLILLIFITEIILKITAEYPSPQRFFRDPWNVFDFLIVGSVLLPIGSQYITVLRILRLLRVLRLVRALPRLRILVSALLKSIPSMLYVGIFLLLLFYIYAVSSVFLYSKNDPVHFANLPIAFLTLFRIVTLEGWVDIMYINMYGCDKYGYDGMEHLCTQPSAMPVFTALYFSLFVLLGTMIILNLFIGVIMNGMDEARKELEAEILNSPGSPGPEEELHHLLKEMKEIEIKLAGIRKAVENKYKNANQSQKSDYK